MHSSRFVWGLFLLLCALPLNRLLAAPAATESDDVLLSSMQTELKRAQTSLSKLDPALYFLSYAASDEDSATTIASQGTLLTSVRRHRRTADVVVRVGTLALDNTHLGNRVSAIDSDHCRWMTIAMPSRASFGTSLIRSTARQPAPI